MSKLSRDQYDVIHLSVDISPDLTTPLDSSVDDSECEEDNSISCQEDSDENNDDCSAIAVSHNRLVCVIEESDTKLAKQTRKGSENSIT